MSKRIQSLLALAAVVGGVWALFNLRDETKHDDAYILGMIAAAYGMAVFVMFLGAKKWSIRGLGLLATMSGSALLYGTASMVGFNWIDRTPYAITDLVRSLFVVGGMLLLYGLTEWLWEKTEDVRNSEADE